MGSETFEIVMVIGVAVFVIALIVALVSAATRIYRAHVDAPLATADLLARLQLLAVEQVENQRKLLARLDRLTAVVQRLADATEEGV